MSATNPGTPTRRGMEWLAHLQRGIALAGASRQAIAVRFQAPSTVALVAWHAYLLDVLGRSGLQGEITDDLDTVPLDPVTDYLPGTASGEVTTGWSKSSGSSAFYTYLDTLTGTPTEWLANTAAMGSSASLKHKQRANATALGSSKRIVSVSLWAYVRLRNDTTAMISGNASKVRVYGLLDLTGVEYVVGSGIDVPRDGKWALRKLADIPLNPATKIPWTVAQFNALTDAATDEIGWQLGPGGLVAASGFNIAGLTLRPVTCAENRYGSDYLPDTPVKGISRRAFSNTRSLKQGDWYRLLIAPLNGEPGAQIKTSALRAPKARIAKTPADLSEQRLMYEVTLTNVGGVAQSSVAKPGEIPPFLLEDAGGIIDGSNPYAALAPFTLANLIGGLDGDGASGSYVTIPNSTKFRVSTAATWVLQLAPDDWTPGADQCIWSMSGAAGNRGWEIWLLTGGADAGKLQLKVSEDGTAQTAYKSTAATGLSDGTGKWVRIKFTANNASGVTFETSDDGVTWSTLGSAVATTGFTDIHPSTADVEILSVNGGTNRFNGRVNYARLYADTSSLDARLDAAFTYDPAYPSTVTGQPGDTTIVAKAGGAATLHGAAALVQRVVGQETTFASGTNPYGAVGFAAGWAGPLEPDAPLVLEVRSGATAYQGAGVLEAVAVLSPAEYRAQGGAGPMLEILAQLRDADGTATWTPAASTKYVIVLRSAASPGRGWQAQLADTLSTDTHTTKTTTTQAQIEGASHQGTTDRAVISADPTGRYDLPVVFVAAPVAPSASVAVKEAA